jgi:hypothetical protein
VAGVLLLNKFSTFHSADKRDSSKNVNQHSWRERLLFETNYFSNYKTKFASELKIANGYKSAHRQSHVNRIEMN